MCSTSTPFLPSLQCSQSPLFTTQPSTSQSALLYLEKSVPPISIASRLAHELKVNLTWMSRCVGSGSGFQRPLSYACPFSWTGLSEGNKQPLAPETGPQRGSIPPESFKGQPNMEVQARQLVEEVSALCLMHAFELGGGQESDKCLYCRPWRVLQSDCTIIGEALWQPA